MYHFNDTHKEEMTAWFTQLRDEICRAFEDLEDQLTASDIPAGRFIQTPWERPGGGGGVMSVMRGRVFEKVGVNISTVSGTLAPPFAAQVQGAVADPQFWASGISLVAHMCSPHVPAVHMNTRAICTTSSWFGGGADLTPMFPCDADTQDFHQALQAACDPHDLTYYPRFKEACDQYFYLPHRQEPRGVGGIFYDHLNTGSYTGDFAYTQDVGRAFRDVYPKLVARHMHKPWTAEERAHQLQKRGRYVEFNLLHDRGTAFGLQTGGNIDAIFMSLPPMVSWA